MICNGKKNPLFHVNKLDFEIIDYSGALFWQNDSLYALCIDLQLPDTLTQIFDQILTYLAPSNLIATLQIDSF